MVQAGRLVTGAIFLFLFAGFELHIPAITNLIPGSYGGLPYTGYIGFGFLIPGITGVAYGLSTPSRPSYSAGSGAARGMADPATMMAAMAAMQQAQQPQMAGSGGGSVLCSSCGKFSLAGAKFCSFCAAPLAPATNPVPATAPSASKSS